MANIHHAEMTVLIRQEKQMEEKLQQLRKDFGVWKDRVELARDAGRDELAMRARERLDEIRREGEQLRRDLKLIVAKKRLVRRESLRPTGHEVRRAEALLESFRQSGLIDPDEANLEAEFDEIRHHDGKAPPPAEAPTAKTSPEPVANEAQSAPSIDDLTLEDLENLDADELERLLAAEEQ